MECVCGLHLCGKCAMLTGLFGILFLLAGFGALPAMINGWVLVGVYLLLLGIGPMVMGGKK